MNLLSIKNNNEKYAHYTTRNSANQLIIKKSEFRLSSILGVNDPEEGDTIFKYLGFTGQDDNVVETFIGCFCFNYESLNQFRLYGKENFEECSGVSIVINDHFFNPYEYSNGVKYPKKEGDVSEVENKEKKLYPISRCIYIDPEKRRVISIGRSDDEDDTEIKDIKGEVEKLLTSMKEKIKIKDLDKTIVCRLLLPIRFLIKNAAFKEEQECRIVCRKSFNDDLKEKDIEKREIKFTDDDSHMYINYQQIDEKCLEKIIFGPKAKGSDIFDKALSYYDIECRCEKSKLPFA